MASDSASLVCALLLLAGLAWPSPAPAQVVYWTDGADSVLRQLGAVAGARHGAPFRPRSPGIWRAALDGSGARRVHEDAGGTDSIALDPVRRSLYWGDYFGSGIRRATYDGSGVTKVVDTPRVYGLGVDPGGRIVDRSDRRVTPPRETDRRKPIAPR